MQQIDLFVHLVNQSRNKQPNNIQTSKPACKLQVFLMTQTSVVQQEEEGEDRDSRRPRDVEEADELLGLFGNSLSSLGFCTISWRMQIDAHQ